MNITGINFSEIVPFFLIMIRSFAILYPIPYMEDQTIDARIKVGFAFFLAIIMYPFVRETVVVKELTIYFFISAVIMELLLGMSIGFIMKLFFAAVQFGGDAAGTQMGLGMSQIFDPTAATNISIFSSFMSRITMMVFLIYNIDHFLIQALYFSMKIIPVGGFLMDKSLFYWLTVLGTGIPAIAFQVVMPIIAIIFLIQVAFGIVSKAVPQINIFFISSIVTIFIGLGVFMFAMPYLLSFTEKQFFIMNEKIIQLLNQLKV